MNFLAFFIVHIIHFRQHCSEILLDLHFIGGLLIVKGLLVRFGLIAAYALTYLISLLLMEMT